MLQSVRVLQREALWALCGGDVINNIHRGNSEPTFTTDVQVEVLDGSSIQNGFFVLNALCHGCRSWSGGSLDSNTTEQPFIYAVGPNSVPVVSDSQSAGLRRHDSYGRFFTQRRKL